ncbi:MAG: ankyrin repeat domain-containing protein [Proteobacteria bacterium]|jgi:ankyrin repeat protein|nr:ankyrin repeat domain-containing protein [Pseudomonadota bacterium]MBK9250870.1 ankyrin repeat domain-containing protein [Pseudomonadota bacterium]
MLSKPAIPVRGYRIRAFFGLMLLGFAAAGLTAGAPLTLGDLVRQGKRDSVIAAITSPDVDVNARAPDGSTALMWAVFNVDKDLVRALLKAGARADVTNTYGASALGEAVKIEDVELVRMLLDAGANVDSPNLDRQTALMLAVSMGSLEISKLLVERGADVNAVETFRGQNALMWAAGGNQPEIVDLLLARGAKNVNLRAKSDDWARQMTSEPRAQFGSRQTGGLTALLYATRSGCLACVQSLVKAGADVNKPNPDGVTPLLNALDNKRWDIAMFLLDKGANPHTWDISGRTPIYVAVDVKTFSAGGGFGGGRGGNEFAGARPAAENTATAQDLIKRLLDLGVDTNHQLTRKRPYGAGRGRFADYDLRGGVGPLFVAATRHDHESMQALLAHGAEVDLPNVFQMTPLMMAAGMSGTGRGAGGGGPPGGASADPQARAIKTIDLLLAAGADINYRITDSRTHTAKLMAYVAGRDQEGRTALFAAAEQGQDRLVKHLLERGADASIRDAAGKTALDIARAAPAAAGGGAGGREGAAAAAAASRAATITALEAAAARAVLGGATPPVK